MGQNGPKRKSRLKKSILNTFKYSHVWSIFEANFVKIPNMASKYRSYAKSKVKYENVRFLADFVKNARFAYVFIYSVQTVCDMKNLKSYAAFKIS